MVLESYHSLDTYRNVFVDCDREILLTAIQQVRQSMSLLAGELLDPASDNAQLARDILQPSRDGAQHVGIKVSNYVS